MSGSLRARLVALLLFGALGLVGCASDSTPTGDSTGSLSLELTVAEGFQIDEVLWTISGGSMPDMMGTINTSAPGSTASVEVFGLPPGEGYLIEMEATSSDGELSCKGSATFDVTVAVVTEVHVMLNCKKPGHEGGVRVNGKYNICAQLTKVVVSPLQTSVGNEIDLASDAIDDEDDPIAYLWTSTSGSIADPTAPTTTYTCTEAGSDSITIVVSDDGFDYCMSGWTVEVTCVMGDGNLCNDVTCEDDGKECTVEACNAGTGVCEHSPAVDGTGCNDGAGMCMDGECVDSDLCTDVLCEDLGECQNNICNPNSGECNASSVDDGTSCDGGAGACVDGSCVEIDLCVDVVCDDLGECQNNTCNPATGACDASNVDDGTSCDDGAGMCMSGSCIDADLCQGVVCEDIGECQNNICNPDTGLCGASNADDGTSCDDGAGSCMSGTCVEIDLCLDVVCDDLGECQNNTCNPATGVCDTSNAEDGASCDDGPGACVAGTCVAVDLCVDVVCDDLGECQNNTCNPATGTCEGSDVDDGIACNGGAGQCTGGECVTAGTTLVVDYTGPLAAFSGQEIVFNVDVANTAAGAATNVIVILDLPDEGVFVSSNPAGVLAGDSLTLSLGDIGPGASSSATLTWLAPDADTTLVSAAEASADNTGPASDSHEVAIGIQTVVTGGATAAGTGLRHRANGNITIEGVPAGAVVTRAVLVWAILFQDVVPSNQITFEGQLITPDLTQTISDNLCWGDTDTIGFAADVTGLVTGNGVYSVTDPVNGVVRLDNLPFPVFPVTDGASLIVFYGAPGLDAQVLSDFSYTAESNADFGVNARTLNDIVSVGGAATLYLAGPDGQTNFSEEVRVTGASTLNLDSSWDGSDPQVAPDFFLGNLWDTDVYDVTSLLPAGQTSLLVEVGLGNDCTGVSAVVLEVEQ